MENEVITCTQTSTKATQTHYDYIKLINNVETQGRILYGNNFQIQEIDRPVVLKIISYFLRDVPVATGEGLDLNKGLMLAGPIGCGKTAIMRIMQTMLQQGLKPGIVPCRELTINFVEVGPYIIQEYSRRCFHQYSGNPKTYCFDDLGLEHENVTWYGNSYNVMAEILLSRYELFISCKMITHVTTNLLSTHLEKKYGSRVRSRMRQMFNLVGFDAKSPDKRR